MSEVMNCGHPKECLSEIPPDFEGDLPGTQRIGTAYCGWCAEVAFLQHRIIELEFELERDKP